MSARWQAARHWVRSLGSAPWATAYGLSCLFGFSIALALLALADVAWARVGGGHSYSGSSSSRGGGSSGGSGGGDAGLAYLVIRILLWIILEHPVVGIPLTIIVVVGWVYYQRQRTGTGRIATGSAAVVVAALPAKTAAGLGSLRRSDPNFSIPLFMDFIRLLFVRTHEARGPGRLEPIRPFVQDNVAKALVSPNVKGVSDIVVGSAHIAKIASSAGRTYVDVLFEANYTEIYADHKERRLYAKERWRFGRREGVLSKGPEEIASLSCPACGNTVALDPNGRCTACQQVVNKGDFHWQVVAVSVLEKHPPAQVPVGGSGGGREHGLDRRTVFPPNFAVTRKTFGMRYPEFSWPAFEARAREAVIKLNAAWSTKKWNEARPYETDYLFDTHRFWIERYQRSGLTNRIEQIEIQKVIPCKIEQDAFFDAITVRIFAKMLDYTVRDQDGAIVDGSNKRPREFSEYWTFIRKSGFDAAKQTKASSCPSCAAPLNINLAGVCEYCSAHITTGDFDWVLTAIDQDEDYRG